MIRLSLFDGEGGAQLGGLAEDCGVSVITKGMSEEAATHPTWRQMRHTTRQHPSHTTAPQRRTHRYRRLPRPRLPVPHGNDGPRAQHGRAGLQSPQHGNCRAHPRLQHVAAGKVRIYNYWRHYAGAKSSSQQRDARFIKGTHGRTLLCNIPRPLYRIVVGLCRPRAHSGYPQRQGGRAGRGGERVELGVCRGRGRLDGRREDGS